ncbi:MAG: hypothetical protein PHW33_00025 [Candidatus Portnoybacteria bacterium]|jgi:hypothetical protein|nr:hypothetical protein [Candidatus Portnoybacteria bacterium]
MVLKGRLEFYGWANKWTVVDGEEERNLKDYFLSVLNLIDQEVLLSLTDESFFVSAAENSGIKMAMVYGGNEDIAITTVSGEKKIDLKNWLENFFLRINGRKIEVMLDIDQVSVLPMPENGLNFLSPTFGDLCEVKKDDALRACRPCQEDACLFIKPAAVGFVCQKFDRLLALKLLGLLAAGKISGRIGNCGLLRRKN